jgi:hypothetical protein
VICLWPLLVLEPEEPDARLPATVGAVWMTLLELCAAQYVTVPVDDVALHFYLACVLLFAALTLILATVIRRRANENELG